MMKPSWINEGKPPLLVERLYFYSETPLAYSRVLLGKIDAGVSARFREKGGRYGDLLVLDNVLAAHGRMPFTGARRILLAMT